MNYHPHSPVLSDTPVYETANYYEDYRTDILSAVDWLGNRFSPGDMVLYCIGAGRGQMLAYGRIQKMRAREMRWGEGTRWNIEVQVLTEGSSGNWGNEKRTRPAWVNPMNITALQGLANLPLG